MEQSESGAVVCRNRSIAIFNFQCLTDQAEDIKGYFAQLPQIQSAKVLGNPPYWKL